MNRPRGTSPQAGGGRFAKGDVVFAKPLVDLLSMLGDDYYRPGTSYKNPSLLRKFSFLR